MLRRLFTFVFMLLMLSACSTVHFNETYDSSQWKTVLVAPFGGKFGTVAHKRFIHEFGTNSKIRFVIPEMVVKTIKEKELVDQYEEAPITVLIDIANQMGADGFVYGEISTDFTEFGAIAELDVKLIDADTGVIVGSSLKERSSLFVGEESLVESGMLDIGEEFRIFFKRMNPAFDG